jgi:hypothetical protein
MRNTEEIIAQHKIENAADATLIRLAGLAAAMPSEEADSLVKRMNFSHARDATLAHALIEAVRANTRSGQNSRKMIVLAALLGALAVGLAALSIDLRSQLNAERAAAKAQVDHFTAEVAEIQAAATKSLGEVQAATATALKSSDESTKESVALLAKTAQQYLDRVNDLAAENARLKSELDAATAAKKP